jgi:regulator of nucleoside diphosphate kinase
MLKACERSPLSGAASYSAQARFKQPISPGPRPLDGSPDRGGFIFNNSKLNVRRTAAARRNNARLLLALWRLRHRSDHKLANLHFLRHVHAALAQPLSRPTTICHPAGLWHFDALLAGMASHDAARTPLLARLDSVVVIPDREPPSDLVTLGAEVRFCIDGASPVIRFLTAGEATARPGLLSVLTPLGNTLLGCTAGACASYRDRQGRSHTVTIDGVLSQVSIAVDSERNVIPLHRPRPFQPAIAAGICDRDWPDGAA